MHGQAKRLNSCMAVQTNIQSNSRNNSSSSSSSSSNSSSRSGFRLNSATQKSCNLTMSFYARAWFVHNKGCSRRLIQMQVAPRHEMPPFHKQPINRILCCLHWSSCNGKRAKGQAKKHLSRHAKPRKPPTSGNSEGK